MNTNGCAAVLRLSRAVGLWREKTQVERDCAALLSMSDEMLRDIGVDRHEILEALACGRSRRRIGS